MTLRDAYEESLDATLGEIANYTRRIRKQRVGRPEQGSNIRLLQVLRAVSADLREIADTPICECYPSVVKVVSE